MKLSLLVMNFQNSKEVAMFDTIHLTNMLRSEVEGVPETGLPLDAFPDKIQEIILNLARYENYGQTNEKYKEDSRKSSTAYRKPITYSRASNFGSKNEM